MEFEIDRWHMDGRPAPEGDRADETRARFAHLFEFASAAETAGVARRLRSRGGAL